MMIRLPLALRVDPTGSVRDQIYEAARLGARGVVLDASGELAPHRLSATGRRDLRHVLGTVELTLAALSLPLRRPLDTTDQLDERVRRAEAVFLMAYELGTKVVLARTGAIPSADDEAGRFLVFKNALFELGTRAERHGTRLALESGFEPGEKLKLFLDSIALPGLAASIDPANGLQSGIDPVKCVRELASLVVHAYATDVSTAARAAPNPRGFGYPPGALDWEEYLGAFEEIGYRGYLTIWPAPGSSVATQFASVVTRLEQLS
jgi:sugar phosphate isomerase/epimerase